MTKRLEQRMRGALHGAVASRESLAAGVLAGIGERSPREAAREAFARSLRGWCAVSALVLAGLIVVAAGLADRPAPGANETAGTPRIAGPENPQGVDLPAPFVVEDYLREYSSEDGVLAAAFTEGMMR